jgi:rod shape-determining protein MreD
MTRGRALSFWILVLLLVVAYFFLHLALGLGAVVPDLLTVALLLAARQMKAPHAAALGLLLGLLRDSLSLVAFGADVIALTLLGYLGSRSRDLFMGDSLLFVGIYLTAGKLLHDLIYYLIAGSALGGGATQFVVQLPLVLYAAVAGLGALLLYRVAVRER